MNYKNIFLSMIFMPFFIIGGDNVDLRIEELNAQLFEKLLALSKMGEEMERIEELIETLMLKYQTKYGDTLASLNDKEKEEFRSEFLSFLERADQAIRDCQIKDFFIKEFFSNKKKNDELGRIKSLVIRAFVEKQLLKKVITDYEELFQTAAEINYALDQLKNK